MPDLLSTLIPLTPEAPAELPANLGRATHAWFMDRVRAHDHRLAARLHEPNHERPFTVSNLVGGRRVRDRGRGEMLQVEPEHVCSLRLTSFEPALTALLSDVLLPALPESVTLAGVRFRLGEAGGEERGTGGEQWEADRRWLSWLGESTFAALVMQHTLQDPMPTRLTLRFASPTVFKSQNQFLPLPLPRLVFEGLARRWNAFAPIQIHPDVNRYAEECMVISNYRLHTETVKFGEDGARGAFPGFVGSCTYVMRVRDRYWMGLIHLLAAFALYAGVGKDTARGMGQVAAGPT